MEENAKSEEESFKTPGERIVKLCEKQQISQRELARRIGVTSSQISRILKGETKTINSDMLMALAQEFGVSTDYILGIVNNPENTQSVENTENLPAESKDMEERREQPFHTPMLLMSSAFPLGGCIDFIESLADQDEKMMAYAEYYYFSGHHEKAVEYAEMYLDHPDIMLKMSACLIYTFANLSLNHIHSARMGLNRLTENLDGDERKYGSEGKGIWCLCSCRGTHTSASSGWRYSATVRLCRRIQKRKTAVGCLRACT